VRKLKTVVIVALALVATALVLALFYPLEPVPTHPYFARHELMVIAHRGGRGLWPENTLYAFRHAAQMGVDIIEMDIRASADGALVAFHDEEVVRTTDGEGTVADLTLEQLKTLDAGYTWTNDNGATFPFRGVGIQVTTLDEVLTSLPGIRLVTEIKPPSSEVAIALCRLLRDRAMQDNVLVASFHQEAMDAFRQACPTVATGATPREALFFYQLNRFHLDVFQKPEAEALQVPRSVGDTNVLTPRFLSGARKFNMRVHVWTINAVDDMMELVRLGIDGIMTDYPDRLMKVLGRRLGSVERESDDVP
jgi:glycerophosphoryl diester phosphodiesterase